MIIWCSESKELVYCSCYLAPQGRFHEMALIIERLWAQALMATVDQVQSHRIELMSKDNLETPRARMWSQIVRATELAESAYIVDDVHIRDSIGNMLPIWTLIKCNAISIYIVQRILKWLGYHMRQHESPPLDRMEEWYNMRLIAGRHRLHHLIRIILQWRTNLTCKRCQCRCKI